MCLQFFCIFHNIILATTASQNYLKKNYSADNFEWTFY